MKNNPYYYSGENPTVDLIIINPFNKVLLIKRSKNTNACPNQWAFPGGFIDTTASKNEFWTPGLETPEQAAIRELKEETNLTLSESLKLNLVGIYEGNNRDPRDNEQSWSKSYAYMVKIPNDIFQEQKNKIKGMDDAQDVNWFSFKQIKNMSLAFDHNLIFLDMEKIFTKNHWKNVKKF